MSLFSTLHRWASQRLTDCKSAWLNHCLVSATVRAAAERDELAYLEECYGENPYNQDLHADILYSRAYIRALETEQDRLRAKLRPEPYAKLPPQETVPPVSEADKAQ